MGYSSVNFMFDKRSTVFKWQVLKTESKILHGLFDYQMFTLDDLYTPIYSKATIL